ncbi:hypothetical protein CHS0354_019277 [Potamilus streckersoni]|uniref:Aminopeptidase n=1 Tax=Potamilus streckersoni TaxID=2493646 RepID=A0AAE0RM55_9BIVA|nr:hypothetical protein CHS0354_019277 [Potamilus streckersoni]
MEHRPITDVCTKSRNSSFYVTPVSGFIFLLLSAVLAVGVGLLVHFTRASDVTCICQRQAAEELSSRDLTQLVQKCGNLVDQGHGEICQSCLRNVSSSTASNSLPTSSSVPYHGGRLPKSLEPILYKLLLYPDFYGPDPKAFFFTGSVWIHLKCVEDTDKIVLNSNKLNITEGSVVVGALSQGVNSPTYVNHTEDKFWQFLTVHVNGVLLKGNEYFIQMNFTGPLRIDFAGLYLSSYTENGLKRYMATTQFSPTDARKAFPCMDEPDRKALFDVTLVRRQEYISLSNIGIIRSEDRRNGYVADVYARTPKMSTYLLAIIICNFSSTDKLTPRGIKFTAWAYSESINKTSTALDIGVKALNFYEEYFGINFPLPKQDMIAIRETAVGAMENWGLITYSENSILYYPETSSEMVLNSVARTISHELAHQWFGNLVTMKWWNDLMLKGGFALDTFPLVALHQVFDDDSLVTSHPVYMPLAVTTEIRQVFDSISYTKGAAMIRMLKFILGEDTFRRGLKRYLQTYQYDNVDHDDLWYIMGNQSCDENKCLDVKTVMDTWVLQMNYPVVKISKTENGMLKLTQTRFIQNENATEPGKHPSPFSYVWKIPITYTTSHDTNYTKTDKDIIWMDTSSMVIADNAVPVSKWVIGNIGQWGYYRVTYDKENWKALLHQLQTNHTKIHLVNRAQIINDAWSLAKASQLDLDTALGTLDYLDLEQDYIPWSAASKEMSFLDVRLVRTAIYGKFQRIMRAKTKKAFMKFSMNDRGLSHIDTYFMSTLVELSCGCGLPKCVSQAKELFQRWMNASINNTINPDIRYTVYCTAIREGGEEEWDFAYSQMLNTTIVSEENILLSALSCSRSLWVLTRYIQYITSMDVMSKRNAVGAIVAISKNPIGQSLAWDLITSRWDYFIREYSDSLFLLRNMVIGVTGTFTTNEKLKQLKEFVERTLNLGTARTAFEQAVEKVKANIKWIDDNYPNVNSWLDRQVSKY